MKPIWDPGWFPSPEGDIPGIIVIAVMAEACALGISRVEQRDLVGDAEAPIWIREIASALSSPPLIRSVSVSD